MHSTSSSNSSISISTNANAANAANAANVANTANAANANASSSASACGSSSSSSCCSPPLSPSTCVWLNDDEGKSCMLHLHHRHHHIQHDSIPPAVSCSHPRPQPQQVCIQQRSAAIAATKQAAAVFAVGDEVCGAGAEQSESEWITEFGGGGCGSMKIKQTKEMESEKTKRIGEKEEKLCTDKGKRRRCVTDCLHTDNDSTLVSSRSNHHHSTSHSTSSASSAAAPSTSPPKQNNSKCKKHFFKLFLLTLALFHFCATCNNYQLQRRIQLVEEKLSLFHQQIQLTRVECSAALNISLQLEKVAHEQRTNSFVESSVNLFNRVKNMTSSSMSRAWDAATTVPLSVSWLGSSLFHTPNHNAMIADSPARSSTLPSDSVQATTSTIDRSVTA